ncbi:MAG: PaaI family thioesterase [Acidobacteriota bacterium]|nr:PaaI family thioesterase [Acidobacteriota bacterium]
MKRERTFVWADPTPRTQGMATLSGLEVLRLVIGGELPQPPMAHLMDIRLVEVENGRTVFESIPGEFHYNPLGTVHGGFGATLLDSAMGCAVHSTLDAGDAYTTLELKINFLRPLTHATGLVRGIGTILHAGRTTALAEGRIEDQAGKIYAFATSTCLIRRSSRKGRD